MDREEVNNLPPKEYPPIDNKYITLFEQRFIGGSVRVGDKLYDSPTVLDDYVKGEGVLPPDYSKTLAELEYGEDHELIKEERNTRFIVGLIAGFGLSVMDVADEGYGIAMELPDLGSEDEGSRYSWKVFLVPTEFGQSSKNPKVLSLLKPAGELGKILHYEPQGDHLSIRLKTWEEYNAV